MSLAMSLLMICSQRVLHVAILHLIVQVRSECQVLVHEPWPAQYLLVPQDSTVEIHCTAADSGTIPFWAIDLHDSNVGQIRAGDPGTIFKDHGFYVLPAIGTPSTLKLLINDTTLNNQTEVICTDHSSVQRSTTLLIYELTRLTLKVRLEILNVASLSWSQNPQVADRRHNFSLSVTDSSGSSSQVISINESYYNFTAPEDTPPCEVYNFSVTTTYIGATYIGAGCSEPSNVLSTMLPSLPNISQLEASLEYVLKKQSTDFALYVSFEPAGYCYGYPIMNYTLEVNGTRNEKIQESVLTSNAKNFSINDLSEDTVYSFRIDVANTVGVVSTSDRQIYTTDVQAATATLIEGVNMSTIQCEFIEDSNATGCKVVLTTKNGQNVYYNLRKNQNTNSTILAVTLELPPSCYSEVEAFDIESDGAVGSLAFPGHIMNSNPSQALCTPATLEVKPSSSGTVWEAWMIAVISVVVFILILSTVIVVIIGVCKSKKSQERVRWCPCMCQCSVDAQVELQERVQVVNSRNKSTSEEPHLPDQIQHNAGKSITAAEGEMEIASSDMPTNCQPKDLEPVVSASLYSEIASTSKLGGHTTLGGGIGKSENVYSEPGSKGPPTKRGKASGVPLEEKLYNQPDHIYFTLEPDRPRHNIIPSPTCTSPQTPFIPDTQCLPPPATTSVSPPPVYQEITEISSRSGGSATRAVTTNGDSSILLSSASPPHVQRSCSVQGATNK